MSNAKTTTAIKAYVASLPPDERTPALRDFLLLSKIKVKPFIGLGPAIASMDWELGSVLDSPREEPLSLETFSRISVTLDAFKAFDAS